MVLEGQYLERMAVIPAEDLFLEGLYHRGDRAPPVVIAAAHPRFGGSMDAPPVAETAWAVTRAGHATLRFNYRGVGASQGEPDAGAQAAEADLEAAMAHLTATTGQPRLGLVGHGFGAWVALRVAARRPDVVAVGLISPAVDRLDFPSAVRALEARAGGPPPVQVVLPERDPALAPQAVAEIFAPVCDPDEVRVVVGADAKFLEGLPEVGRAMVELFGGRRRQGTS